MKRRHSWWYAPVFAFINWCEASVTLICLGRYSPPWAIDFAAWYALRHIKRSKP